MKLSLVLSTHAAQFKAVALKGAIEANIARIAAWGYDGVELAIRDPALVDAEALAALVEARGLTVSAIGTGQAWGEEHLSFTDPDPDVRAAAITRIQRHIALAARLDAIIIIGLIRGRTPPGHSSDWALDAFSAAMEACARPARVQGVRFAIEPLNRYETDLLNTAAEALDFVARLGLDNVGLLLDTFHMNIEEPDIQGSIRRCGSRVFHVHIADSNRWYPGAGHLDFRAILAALREIDYDGWLSGEFLPQPDASTAAKRGIAYMRQLLT